MDVIAVVTGATRGAGKGIAIALGEAGATVYVTGRSVADGDSPYGGTVSETADLVTQAGGKGIANALDHADDEAVAALFARVKAEHGRLDILVNNAAKVVASTTMSVGFWQKPLEAVDLITVGLRSHFVAAYHAAPLLIANGRGLIVQTGHYGAVVRSRSSPSRLKNTALANAFRASPSYLVLKHKTPQKDRYDAPHRYHTGHLLRQAKSHRCEFWAA